ncbi:sensor histidine kinase [Streptomyces rectiverticillatus]|uniref:sensor histidine kinase n=1 Tax=Streptomyces rectiverticillatus TaxID=173860 RepID=UPI0015C2F001|nr:sensor histidine kinase [Streptomyces rectiverticillatus]QLE75239.1 sensor histidine kinase [Streptomyces rectiverticillatus]
MLIGTWLSATIAIRYSTTLLIRAFGWNLRPRPYALLLPADYGLQVLSQTCDLIVSILLVRLLALLPDGAVLFPYERRILRALWGLLALPLLLPLTGMSQLSVHYVVFYYPEAWMPGLGAVLLVVRCLRAHAVGRPDVAALLPFAAPGAALLLVRAASRLFRSWQGEQGVLYFVGAVLGALPYVSVSLVIVYAAFRHRLLGVDLVIRRSAVYGSLWLIINSWYLGMALTLGLTAGQYFPVGLSLLVAVVATALFQPLRARLNALAERRVFGKRLSRFELLVQFGTTLEHAYDLDRLAPQLATGLREGLNLQWVAVRLGGDGLPVSAARAGERPPGTAPLGEFPLLYGEDVLGLIEYGPKAEGRCTPEDHDIGETLARSAALAVHNMRLAAELCARVEEVQRQAAELDASRARIVHAQDTERRRIERRLHDGIQQELVALVAKLALARNRLHRGGDIDAALTEVQDDAYRVIDGLRELAHGIHPPILTDQGLVAAVTSCARRMPLPVTVHSEESLGGVRFALDIEESAFYLVSEALTNVLKHAGATHVTIRMARSGGRLLVEVRDDGAGFPTETTRGSGLTGMRDRIEAVGGELTITSGTGTGTVIRARLVERVREETRA